MAGHHDLAGSARARESSSRTGLEEAPSGWSHVFDLACVALLAALWSLTVPTFTVLILVFGITLVLARIWMYRPGGS